MGVLPITDTGIKLLNGYKFPQLLKNSLNKGAFFGLEESLANHKSHHNRKMQRKHTVEHTVEVNKINSTFLIEKYRELYDPQHFL